MELIRGVGGFKWVRLVSGNDYTAGYAAHST